MSGGAIELIAQAIHERWRSEQLSAGNPSAREHRRLE
jgi:hypothetical protein